MPDSKRIVGKSAQKKSLFYKNERMFFVDKDKK